MKEKLVKVVVVAVIDIKTMVVISPILKYGPYGDHTFANLPSPFAPSIWLTCLPHDGLVKLCDDQVFSHKTFGIPHKILYPGQ